MSQGEGGFSQKNVVQKAFFMYGISSYAKYSEQYSEQCHGPLLYSTVYIVVVNTVQVNELSRQSFSCHLHYLYFAL